MPDPALADVAKFPLWGQIGTVIAALAAITVSFREGFKRKETREGDTVVVSGAFADAQPIRELLATVRADEVATRDLTAAVRDLARDQADRARDLRDAMVDMRHEQRATNELLAGIGSAIGKGVNVKIAPGE